MKYSKTNPPIICMQTQSTCYRGTRTMTIKGVLWHSTGANNPNLKRYVQPSDNDPNKAKLLKILGTNASKNDWNHIYREAGLNAWVGKLADGTLASVQTMPWNYRPWGCGSGKKGSCNTGWIQFEICEDDLTSPAYFSAAYQEAVQLTAFLCRTYGLDPHGTVSYQGVKVPVILCHQDSYRLGLGSNHGDVYHWFNRYGKTMDDVRNDVQKAMNEASTSTSTKEEPELTETQVRNIAREEFNRLLEERAKLPATAAAWAAAPMEKAKAAGITDGTSPQAFATREQVAIMALRALEARPE